MLGRYQLSGWGLTVTVTYVASSMHGDPDQSIGGSDVNAWLHVEFCATAVMCVAELCSPTLKG